MASLNALLCTSAGSPSSAKAPAAVKRAKQQGHGLSGVEWVFKVNGVDTVAFFGKQHQRGDRPAQAIGRHAPCQDQH